MDRPFALQRSSMGFHIVFRVSSDLGHEKGGGELIRILSQTLQDQHGNAPPCTCLGSGADRIS